MGNVFGLRTAVNLMKNQKNEGHIFTLNGAGANGDATPMYSVYGSTKRAIT